MKLRDMLNQVGVLVPNDIPIDMQVSWMNQTQSSLYRFFESSEAAFEFVVQPNESFYDLPVNCIEGRTQRLVVDGEDVMYIAPEEDDTLRDIKFWTVFNKQVFLSPVPDRMQEATLYYKPSPTVLSVDAIDSDATFPTDFIELVILGCAIKVALATRATDILPVLQLEFERLKDRAEQIMGYKTQRFVNVVRPFS